MNDTTEQTNTTPATLDWVVNQLNGKTYDDFNIGNKLEEIFKIARDIGVVIVYGCSDDLIEFRGAIYDECGAHDKTHIYLDSRGLFEECECNCKYSQDAKSYCSRITAFWCKKDSEYDWSFEANIEHKTFEILEDDEKYCMGIAFYKKEL